VPLPPTFFILESPLTVTHEMLIYSKSLFTHANTASHYFAEMRAQVCQRVFFPNYITDWFDTKVDESLEDLEMDIISRV